jgi:hypothetical protein
MDRDLPDLRLPESEVRSEHQRTGDVSGIVAARILLKCPKLLARFAATAHNSRCLVPLTVKPINKTTERSVSSVSATRSAESPDSRSSTTRNTGVSTLSPLSFSTIRFAALPCSAKAARLQLKSITSSALKSGSRVTVAILLVFMTAQTFAAPAMPTTAVRQLWRTPASGSNQKGGVPKISEEAAAATAFQGHTRVSRSAILRSEAENISQIDATA